MGGAVTEDNARPDKAPLSETLPPSALVGPRARTGDLPGGSSAQPELTGIAVPARIAPGETLQLVRFKRHGQVLKITGLTPHGRRLTFEQRADREGWYVVAAGRRRRPTKRELGLVVASITQEMEAARAPEGDAEVRSAYALASSSDQTDPAVLGLQAYRDLLLDESAAYCGGQVERLAVIAIEYQAFKRFAVRHGHRIGAAFVHALGERLAALYGGLSGVHVCHKAGKSFRLIAVDKSLGDVESLLDALTSEETKQWLVHRVWGHDRHSHPEEVNFYIGFAFARSNEREGASYVKLAQRLNDDAYRAAKLGQLRGQASLANAKSFYRTTVAQWLRASDDEVGEIAAKMDDGPADVMAEMSDFLNELVPADLEGMAVEGDVHALLDRAIARDGFWQGTTAMGIAAKALLRRFFRGEDAPPGQHDYVGGFDLGDEFYGLAREGGRFYFAWGDVNSAGATRVRAGLKALQSAVGWQRADGGGLVGSFIQALAPGERPLTERVRQAAGECHRRLCKDPKLKVNDSVDVAQYLWTKSGDPVRNESLVQGAELSLKIGGRELPVRVLEVRSRLALRLEIDGAEHVASYVESVAGPVIKLRVREAVVSLAVCVLKLRREALIDMLDIVREDNGLDEEQPMNVVAFLRHVADLMLAEQVKAPAKIGLALGERYDPHRFIREYTLEDVREEHPGLFFEAVHQSLLQEPPAVVDRNLRSMIAQTMLTATRPPNFKQSAPEDPSLYL